MDEPIRQRLLQLNQDFYAAVAEPFNQTRQDWTPGKRRLLDIVPSKDHRFPTRVADIGCGNGRFAMMLESLGGVVEYTGVDGSEHLLALAAEQATSLTHVHCRFEQADLAQIDWLKLLSKSSFDMVVCLATLQHMPSYELRSRLVRDLASLLVPGGLLAISAWQFLGSERFRKRLIDWSEVGLTATDVEAGRRAVALETGRVCGALCAPD